MKQKRLGRKHGNRRRGQIDRRGFLGLAAGGLLGACSGHLQAGPFRSVPVAGTGSQRVLIIGAGVAGLAAARSLADLGHDVLVIESRNRIGGRIQTSAQWAGAPMDLGASWIHGTAGNPITQIAQDLGVQTMATDSDAAEIYDTDGSELTSGEYRRVSQLQRQIGRIVTAGQNADLDLPLRETIETGIGFDQLSIQDQRFVNLIITDFEQGLSGSATSISTYWYDDPDYFNGSDVVPIGGYRFLIDHLAAGLNIELGRTVSEIAVGSGGVTVNTQQGVFSGDRAIVTLPLGVLKAGTVKFSPGLPPDMQAAIDVLQMGVLNKAYLRFPSVFWPQNLDWMQQVPTSHGQWVNWLNVDRVVNQPILMGFNAADFGRQIESWTDQEIVAGGMERLRQIFGNSIPDPVDWQITRWASDPHTFGSYSYLPIGAHPAMRDALAGNLEERVFFAGEATNRQYFPTVHSAYLSGLTAAQKVEAARLLFQDGFESGDTSEWTAAMP